MGFFDQEFKRMNFFRGFLTTEKDWNESQQYHVLKRMLHNAYMHGPGVVPHFKGGLSVTSRGRGELALEIAAGYAIDGLGRDIFVPEPVTKTIYPQDFKLPVTVYLVLKYVEEFDDYITYKENPEFKGHRKIAERTRFEFSINEPSIEEGIELCRVYLNADDKGVVKNIFDAKDPNNPQSNEIDLRFVPIAGFVSSWIPPKTKWAVSQFIQNSKITYEYLYHDQKITPAADVLHGLITLEMLLKANYVNIHNLLDIFSILLRSQWEMIEYIERNFRDFSSKREFGSYKKKIKVLKGQASEAKIEAQFLDTYVKYQNEGFEAIKSLFKERIKTKKVKGDTVKINQKMVDGFTETSEELKLNQTIEMQGATFKIVDMIDILNRKSEADHKVVFENYTDKYRTRQKLKYPDGKEIEDIGTALVGGDLSYHVKGLTSGKDVLMLIRIDYVHGDWIQEIHVNDIKVGEMVCKGEDRKFRWRNWPYIIKGDFISNSELNIKHVAVSADRDINFFRIWLLQSA